MEDKDVFSYDDEVFCTKRTLDFFLDGRNTAVIIDILT